MDAIVLAREDVPGDKRLVAYIVPQPNHEVQSAELRQHLLVKLPDYMIPTAFVALDRLPLLANGKINRHALPPPDFSRDESHPDYVAPRNEIEAALAKIFADVLSIEKVGVDDNFFLLGGHSLSATQVITRLRETLHADVPLPRMFETPTVAGLALAVNEHQDQPQEDRIEVISRDEAEAEPLAAMLEKLSREELQALLLEVASKKNG